MVKESDEGDNYEAEFVQNDGKVVQTEENIE